ncbi:arrestin homolog isoform X2 [Daktulosphaira vitifoliae]|uniref:arrestin homolog isoform X2 n=1 Tax=Daktulosphaira vitifoliae TaxID=58002 RepID=UPI0021A9BB2F|nr:arrestin homolog isoform X2 [Daktulosphaira vitifoliae]
MPVNFTVFKKCSSDNKMMLYLCKRDIVDHISFIDPIDGIIVLDNSFLKQGKIFGQVVCSFRYGRKEDEVMGLNFQKDMYLASVQIYPSLDEYNSFKPSNIQVCLLSKLGSNAVPFRFKIPQNAPPSVILQDGSKDRTDACGVQYYVKIFAGLFETDHNRAKEGCPILPGSSIQKTLAMWPALDNVKGRYGVAIEDSIKDKEPSLASSVLVPNADISEVFGIIVSYLIKVKLYLGALGGDLTTELPFLLMNSQEEDVVNVK